MPGVLLGLLAIMLISAVSGWWLARRKSSEKPLRVMMLVGYFWLLTFVQIMLAVLVYQGWRYFLPH